MARRILMISIDGMANYYLAEGLAKMPVVRGLAANGVLAGGMRSVFPTATWAIHTSLVTGTYPVKHGVLGNWVVDRPAKAVGEHFGDAMWGKEQVVKRETIYDLAKRIGCRTASICWPVTRGATTIDWNIPEFYDQALFEAHSTPELWNELKSLGLPVEMYGPWSKDHARGHMQDWLTTEIAKHLLRTRRPEYMQLHYLLPDSYQHDYGTRSKEAIWSLEYVDGLIGELLETLRTEGLAEETTVVVLSDHGFLDTIRTFYPNALWREKGWLDPVRPRDSKVVSVSNGGSGYVYVLDASLRDEVRRTLAEQEGVGRVFEPEHFAALGLPTLAEHPEHAPDFAFEAALDTFVHFDPASPVVLEQRTKFRGMHGYLPEREEMKAVFVAAGPGVPSGVELGEVRVVDVAPTLAALLGETLEGTDGEPLQRLWDAVASEKGSGAR
ncbi:ectonucleotide pyrophosphatase/phosphodiesterase [Paenibacillus sp. TRM 82003]|nr:ectonucleotide pyrophosphatase/phosphodiesterase [Paenibacillus sp. TRM 82003]MCI3923366.1 ectonucleotide pyrophosphatase/phosphodiesterase [Paenibacillus sp. TRM 82003]